MHLKTSGSFFSFFFFRAGILSVSKILLLDYSCKYPIPTLQARASPRAYGRMLFQLRLGCCCSLSPLQKADSFLTGVQDGEAGKRQRPISS